MKPNDTYASLDDKTAATEPGRLRAVLRLVRDAGPARVTEAFEAFTRAADGSALSLLHA